MIIIANPEAQAWFAMSNEIHDFWTIRADNQKI